MPFRTGFADRSDERLHIGKHRAATVATPAGLGPQDIGCCCCRFCGSVVDEALAVAGHYAGAAGSRKRADGQLNALRCITKGYFKLLVQTAGLNGQFNALKMHYERSSAVTFLNTLQISA